MTDYDLKMVDIEPPGARVLSRRIKALIIRTTILPFMKKYERG